MKIVHCFLLVLSISFFYSTSLAQPTAPAIHRVFLTSNFADIPSAETQKYADALDAFLKNKDSNFTFIHNGDLTDYRTKSDVDWDKEAERINTLLASAKLPNSKHILVPGDRDWLHSGKGGWKYVKKLEKLVEENKADGIYWTPGKGCLGPKSKTLSDHVLLIVINTQWWNHPYDKPGPTDADCKISRDADFLEELEDIIEEAGNTNIILAGHFPLESNGPYGGHSTLKQHLLPLPVIGSFYTSYRKNIGTPVDISNERFAHIRKKLQEIVEETPQLIYISGHEQNMEILHEGENFLINSGAAFATSFVRNAPHTLFKSKAPGLIELIYHPDGKVEYQIHEYQEQGFQAKEKAVLLSASCEAPEGEIAVNRAYVPCAQEVSDIAESNFSFPAEIGVVAGAEYKVNGFGQLFLGKLYRDAWTTSIEVPSLDLGKTLGGLTPLERGGGAQTQSLKLRAIDGKEYVFRSVNKNPIQALPNDLKTDFFSYLARQSTATQNPYGALAAAKLLDYTEILHARPKLYALPDDPRLGIYRAEFAGMLGMLEDRPKKPKKGKPGSFDADEILRSYQLFTKLYDDHDNQMDREALLNARVFDIWAGDRGRHEENFKWAGFEQEEGILYRPIPRDRDHIFSRLNGLLPWIIDRPWGLPFFEDFGYEIKDIRSLNYSARHLDRSLLTDASREDWLAATKRLQATFSDEIIEEAMQAMPLEIYENSSREIAAQLVQRRKDLDRYIEEYYLLLAKEVDIWGSNEREYFDIVRHADGSVSVAVFDLASFKKEEKGKKELYRRTFYPKETKEIRVYGLGSKDVFKISGEAPKSIRLRVFGGDGEDAIEDASKVKGGMKKTLVYERNKDSKVDLGSEGKRMKPENKNYYDYQRKIFTYHSYLPIPSLSYNGTEGFGIGWGYNFTRQKFGKEDYSSKHKIGASINIPTGFQINYASRFHHLIGKWDVETAAVVDFPNPNTNFFGIGNESTVDKDLFQQNFYRSRHDTYYLQAGLVRDFYQRSYFSAHAYFESNGLTKADSPSFFDADFDLYGLHPTQMALLKLALNLDFRDDKYFPKTGMRLYLSHQNGLATNSGREDNWIGISAASIEGYISTRGKRPLTLGAKIGASDSYGEIPFYNRIRLGQTTNLKGFYNDRFIGDAAAYLNSELRFRVGTIKNALIPLELGLTAFYDRGRVFEDGVDSDLWHDGYGFGIYLLPVYSQVTLNLSVGFSEEASGLILFRFGSLLR